MLSPHEIAALLLLGDAPNVDDLDPERLDACWNTSWSRSNLAMTGMRWGLWRGAPTRARGG